ncbi:MAG: hypothetical protein V4544_07435 [Pseudomonadota bacterium]
MFRRFIIWIMLLSINVTHICASINNDIRNECEATSVSVLKGHQLFTGVVDLDNELRTRMQNNQPLCDNVQMRKNREEVMGLLLRQIKTELKDMYGVDCSFSDFHSPEAESGRILLSEARRQIDLIISEGLRYGDPAFVVITIERALFAKESPQTAMMNLIKRVSGIPQVEADFNGVANLLTCALLGNTVAAQYAWQDGRFPDDWRLSYSDLQQLSEQKSKEIKESNLTEEEKQKELKKTQNIQVSIQTLSDIRSIPFQYLHARSIFIDKEFDDSQKMEILAGLDTGASLDYWGVLYYTNLIKNTRTDTKGTFSDEKAVEGWHTYFVNAMHRPLSQHFAVKPLLKKDGKPLPRGYIEGLYDFAGMKRSEPFHLVLRKLVEKTKSPEVAKCYLINYLHFLPETKEFSSTDIERLTIEFNEGIGFKDIKNKIAQDVSALSRTGGFSENQIEQSIKEFTDKFLTQFIENRLNERKIAEIMAIGEIVPEARDMLASVIHNQELGYADKTPGQRRELLQDLASEGVQAAQDLLIDDYIAEFANNPSALNLLGNVYHFAFKGNIKAQELLTENKGNLPSLLQLHLAFNQAQGITPFKAKQQELNNEAHNLLRHMFKILNILRQPHDYTGKFVDFFGEAKIFIEEAEKA